MVTNFIGYHKCFSIDILNEEKFKFIKIIEMFQIDFLVFNRLVTGPNWKVPFMNQNDLNNSSSRIALSAIKCSCEVRITDKFKLSHQSFAFAHDWINWAVGLLSEYEGFDVKLWDLLSLLLVSHSARKGLFFPSER